MTTGSLRRQISVSTGGLTVDYGVIEIDIPKTLDANPGESKVSFRNLSLSTEAQFAIKAPIRVSAGQERLQQVFKGQILRVKKQYNKPNTLFTVYLSDQIAELEVDVQLSFSMVPLRALVQSLIASAFLMPGDLTAIPAGLMVDQWAFQGPLKDAFRDVLRVHNFTSFVDDGGRISVARTDMPSPVHSTLLLNADTGLVGSPESSDTGVNVKVLLDTPTVLNQLVSVESSSYTYGYEEGQPLRDTRDTQTYKLFGMHYKGNNWDGEFVNQLRLETLSSPPDG